MLRMFAKERQRQPTVWQTVCISVLRTEFSCRMFEKCSLDKFLYIYRTQILSWHQSQLGWILQRRHRRSTQTKKEILQLSKDKSPPNFEFEDIHRILYSCTVKASDETKINLCTSLEFYCFLFQLSQVSPRGRGVLSARQ